MPDGNRTKWLKEWPGQVVLGVSQTFWTTETTKALVEGGNEGINKLCDTLQGYIDDIIQMVRGKIPKSVKNGFAVGCVR